MKPLLLEREIRQEGLLVNFTSEIFVNLGK